MANIAFFESMTPYWIDMQNALHDKNNYEMYYVYESLYGYDSTPELREQLHFTPHQMSGKHKNSFRLSELYHIIKRNQPESIISIEFSLLTIQLLIIRLITRYTFRVIVRCDDSLDMIQHPYSKTHSIARRCLGRFVDEIILCDSRTQQIFKEKFLKGLYFPIIREEKKFLTTLDAYKQESTTIISKYNLENKKVVLYVGRIDKNKNLASLVQALKSSDTSELALVIIGDGPEKINIMQETEQLTCPVIFTGMLQQTELLPWYNIADVLCLISFKETFGAVVNEALLAGIKCLVSNTAGSSHLIKDGVNGYCCNPHSVNDISSKLKMTIEIPSTQNTTKGLMPHSFEEYYKNICAHL